ncbi:MAG: response regulator transcription factor [Candidatus Gastranaerophilaceae bacterium]
MNSIMNKNMTDRELEVLNYVVQGMTNLEIAEKLMITHHTVKAHIASILRKMGVKNRLSAALLATKKGIINLHQG